MHDMLGFAMLFESVQKNRRRRRAHDRRHIPRPFRRWLGYFIPHLRDPN